MTLVWTVDYKGMQFHWLWLCWGLSWQRKEVVAESLSEDRRALDTLCPTFFKTWNPRWSRCGHHCKVRAQELQSTGYTRSWCCSWEVWSACVKQVSEVQSRTAAYKRCPRVTCTTICICCGLYLGAGSYWQPSVSRFSWLGVVWTWWWGISFMD